MRKTIFSAIIVVFAFSSIFAQTMSWNLVTLSSQNCEGCKKEALIANQSNIKTVINAMADLVVNPSDIEVLASFISYYSAPHSYDNRHDFGSRLIHLANVDSLTRLKIEIMNLYTNSDIGSDVKVATRTPAPALTEWEKCLASANSFFPNDKKRALEYAKETYEVIKLHSNPKALAAHYVAEEKAKNKAYSKASKVETYTLN